VPTRPVRPATRPAAGELADPPVVRYGRPHGAPLRLRRTVLAVDVGKRWTNAHNASQVSVPPVGRT
jgi:hypothetical protein